MYFTPKQLPVLTTLAPLMLSEFIACLRPVGIDACSDGDAKLSVVTTVIEWAY